MLQYLDVQSRWHVRVFVRQVGFLALVGLPVLLVDRHFPALYIGQLRTMFGVAALVTLVLGLGSRQVLSPTSLCVWDHCLAFLLLQTGCSVALGMLG